ncbi:MAG TPA: protein kinase [Vicinamibacterales bacterium]|jgi:serine/threonine protein kinase|nr:protein kinase [Vicinamibacterales bacterium]
MSQSAGACPLCKAPRFGPASVAGTLTPVPGGDDATRYVPATPGPDPDATYYAAPGAMPGALKGNGNRLPDDSTGLPTGAGSVPTGFSSAEAVTIVGDPKANQGAGVRPTPAMRAAEGPLHVGQQFSARYIIVRLLGIGGMGAVYQAWDTELSVMVAVKVVRPEVTRDPVAARDIERRFKQELLLARQVTHRNVVRIHDMGEIDGIKYITMPFIEGDDLATVIRKSGRPEMAALMAIARQVASGLKAAHDAGVIHRDLKPANIMLGSDSEAVIMDFGIAHTASDQKAAALASVRKAGMLPKTLESELTRVAATMQAGTVAGAIVGTVAYMAPEQARGEEVDQRTDIYAFGLILYDLLLGRRRVEDGGAVADLQKRLDQPLPAPRAAALDAPGKFEVPEPLSRFVSQCIEPEAAKRFATTADMVAALARLDDRGKLRPIKRAVGLPAATVAALALLGLSGAVYWFTRPPVQHENVVVVIADMVNRTGDAAFDHTLEPLMRLALDEATFITSFERNGMRGFGVSPTAPLDEAAAHKIALEQGLGVVLSGAIQKQGSDYLVSVKATRTVTGEELVNEQARASSKNTVLQVATGLMTEVRNALGDEDSESVKQLTVSLSARSLDVVRLYAEASSLGSANKPEQALEKALAAVAIDKNFGLGYLIAANAASNLGRSADERKYLELAMQHLDSMTERERYHTRGAFSLASNDYQQCIKEYSDAITRYRADISGRNQLALCLTHQRQMQKAVDEMQEVVKLLPSQPLFRDNLALYLNYAGDFQQAEQEARAVKGRDSYAVLATAFAQLGQGRRADAMETYRTMAAINRRGKSYSAAGLGDLAAYEGRFGDAVRILRAAVAEDLAAQDTDSAAAKLLSIAAAELARGRQSAAVEAAQEALVYGKDIRTRFLAARTFAEAGDVSRARPLVEALDNEYNPEPRAYARIVQGVLALKRGDARRAVISLGDADGLFSTWIGLFDLGRASLDAAAAETDNARRVSLYAKADSAFDACLNARRGEAISIFVDEQPTYAYLPPVHYYLGRARQELKSSRYAESYREYLNLRGSSKEDLLLPEVRKRAGA